MLESMRNQAQSWIAKLILGGIVLSFALWGVGDYFLGSRLQSIAEVDGDPIPDVAFHRAYERQLNVYRSLLGNRFSKAEVDKLGLKEETLQTLINRRVMVSESASLGLAAPKTALLARVRANPAFQSGGSFDANRYRILTRNMGFRTPTDYEQEQRINLMVDALQKAIIESSHVSEEEVRARFASEYEQRVLAAIIVDPASLEKDIDISDSDAKAYYEAHKQSYLSPLRLRLTAVEIDPKHLAKDFDISEADLEAAFEEQKSKFEQAERRHARHILVRVDENASESVRSVARSRIDDAKKRIAAGEDFAKVAKEVSDDATADKGGDLGFFSRGVMVPAFEEAVFSMRADDISDVVETPYGYHLIQLLEVQEAKEPLLDDKVRQALRTELRQAKASDEAYNLSQDLDDALGREDSLRSAAESLNLPVREIGPLSQDEALADPLLGSDASLRNQAFALRPGNPVEVIELDDGRFTAIEAVERLEPEVLPFAKVTARVYADLKRERALELARTKAENIHQQAATRSMDELAQAHGQPKFISKPVRKNGIGDDAAWLTTQVLDAAFRAPAGSVVGHILTVPQGMAVVQVSRVIAAPEEEYAKQAAAIHAELKREKGAVRFARWMASVRDRHDIQVNEAILERL